MKQPPITNEQSGGWPFCMHRGLLIEYLKSQLSNKHMNEYILHWMTYMIVKLAVYVFLN